AIMKAPATDARLIMVARSDECIKRRLRLSEPILAALECGAAFTVRLAFLRLPDCLGMRRRTIRAACLVRHAARLERLLADCAFTLARTWRRLGLGSRRLRGLAGKAGAGELRGASVHGGALHSKLTCSCFVTGGANSWPCD